MPKWYKRSSWKIIHVRNKSWKRNVLNIELNYEQNDDILVYLFHPSIVWLELVFWPFDIRNTMNETRLRIGRVWWYTKNKIMRKRSWCSIGMWISKKINESCAYLHGESSKQEFRMEYTTDLLDSMYIQVIYKIACLYDFLAIFLCDTFYVM